MSRRFRHIARDPYWTSARFPSTCSCGKQIEKGDRIFYYPSAGKAVCEDPCGRNGDADLQNEKQYEASLPSSFSHDPYNN